MSSLSVIVSKNERLSTSLNEFREIGLYCDVRLLIGKKVYNCHRLVLAATSQYFKIMFASNFEERDNDVIKISADVIDSELFESVLQFIYSGQTIITSDNAFGLLKVSHFLQIAELENACSNFIAEDPFVKNKFPLVEYYTMLGKDELVSTMAVKIACDMIWLRMSERLLTIPYDLMRKIIIGNKSVPIDRIPKVEFVKAIFEWVKFDLRDRIYVLNELLSHIDGTDHNEIVIEKYPKLFLSEYKYRMDESLKIICTGLVDQISHKTAVINFKDEGSIDWTLQNWDNIANMKLTTNQGNYYFLWLNEGENPENCFQKYAELNRYCKPVVLSSPPICATNYNIITVGTKIYLYDSSEKFIRHSGIHNANENAIYVYNLKTNKWFSIPKIPERLFDSYLACLDEMIYLIGGYTGFGFEGEKRNVIQCFDDRSPRWITKSIDINFSMKGAACKHRDEIYVYEENATWPDRRCFYVWNAVAGKFRLVDVKGGPSELGFLISSDFEDKMWYVYRHNMDTKIGDIYRPLRNEWEGSLNLPPVNNKLSSALYDLRITFSTMFDAQFC